jgi:outer membrane lipoprotein SlyB
MKRKQRVRSLKPESHHTTEAGAVAGELAGAVVGSAAGPVGAVAGMVVGAVAGALTGHFLENDARRVRAHDDELDEAIGVTRGNLGAASAASPPARVGAPSTASCGVTIPSQTPAEGPIQDIEDEV